MSQEPKMTRDQIKAALARGEHVAIGGRHITHVRDIPPPPVAVEGQEPRDEFVAVVARTANGKLTRAGMEAAIRAGGSVLVKGEVISRVEDLPEEQEVLRHDQESRQAQAAMLDEQIAVLGRQRAALGRAETQ